MHLQLPKDFSFHETLRFLNRNEDECLHWVNGERLVKLLHEGGQQMLISIQQEADKLLISKLKGSDLSPNFIKGYVNHWFDLETDLDAFYSNPHPTIKGLIDDFKGLRVVAIPDLFEAICWSIIGQQINLVFAYKIKKRLIDHFDVSVEFEGRKHCVFPSPGIVTTLEEDELKAMQFSRQKIKYIKIAAEKLASGEISKAKLEPLSYRERLDLLTSVKGIGEWSANYVLMKTMRQQEAIPFGDAGLNQGLRKLLKLDRKPTREETEAFFNKAPGWGAYLTFYIWRSLG